MAQTEENAKDLEEITTRLRRVEGQIRGIQRMIEDGRNCEDIITQLMAARAALDKAGLLVVGHRVHECLEDAPTPELEGRLQRIIELFMRLS